MTSRIALSGPNMHVEGTSASGVRHTRHPRSFTPKLHDIQIGTCTVPKRCFEGLANSIVCNIGFRRCGSSVLLVLPAEIPLIPKSRSLTMRVTRTRSASASTSGQGRSRVGQHPPSVFRAQGLKVRSQGSL